MMDEQPGTSRQAYQQQLQRLTPEEQQFLQLMNTTRENNAGEEDEDDPPKPPPLTQLDNAGMIMKGLICLGIVQEVHEEKMSVLLPGNAIGTVEKNRVSESFTHHMERATSRHRSNLLNLRTLFWRGQVVTVKVLGVDKIRNRRPNIRLTMDPRELHQNIEAYQVQKDMCFVGVLQRKLDKAWQVDLGIPGVVCVLREDRMIYEKYNRYMALVGQLVYVKVHKIPTNGKPVRLTMRLGDHDRSAVNEMNMANYDTIMPGCILHARVLRKMANGMELDIGFGIRVACLQDHVGEMHPVQRYLYQPGNEAIVKVIYKAPGALGVPVYVTTRTDLFPTRGRIRGLLEGRNGVVERQKKKVRYSHANQAGVYITIGKHEENGFIPFKSLQDPRYTCKKDVDKLLKRDCRLVCEMGPYYPFERHYVCRLKGKLSQYAIKSVKKVPPGTIVEAKFVKMKHRLGGIQVKFLNNLRGFIPKTFMPEELYELYSKEEDDREKANYREARVIHYDLSKERLLLTFHKKIRTSTGIVYNCFDMAKRGDQGHGIVRMVENWGVYVKAIGGLKGLITKQTFEDTGLYGGENGYQENLKPGDVLKFQVISVDTLRNQLGMSPVWEDEKAEVEEPKEEIPEQDQSPFLYKRPRDPDSDGAGPSKRFRGEQGGAGGSGGGAGGSGGGASSSSTGLMGPPLGPVGTRPHPNSN